jgi:hypothetical protein
MVNCVLVIGKLFLFSELFEDSISSETVDCAILSAEEQKAQLEPEPWFHGVISRSEAEALLRNVRIALHKFMLLVNLCSRLNHTIRAAQ